MDFNYLQIIQRPRRLFVRQGRYRVDNFRSRLLSEVAEPAASCHDLRLQHAVRWCNGA